MSVIKEWANQSIFLSSILCAFSLAIAVQLICTTINRRIAGLAIAVFLASAAALLVTTFMGSLILIRSEAWQSAQALPRGVGVVRAAMNELFMVGLILFLVGLGLTGWLRSKLIGVVATLTALLAGGLILWVIRLL